MLRACDEGEGGRGLRSAQCAAAKTFVAPAQVIDSFTGARARDPPLSRRDNIARRTLSIWNEMAIRNFLALDGDGTFAK